MYVLTHVPHTRRLRLAAVQVKINMPRWFDFPEHAGIRVHHIDETRIAAVQLRLVIGGREEWQRRIQSGQAIEQDAGRPVHNVAGEADHVGAQTEADQVQTPELLAPFGRIGLRAQSQQELAETLARLAGVQDGGRIARQLGELAPVGDDDVGGGVALQVSCSNASDMCSTVICMDCRVRSRANAIFFTFFCLQ